VPIRSGWGAVEDPSDPPWTYLERAERAMVKKVLLIVFGAIGALVGIGLLIGGAVIAAITSGDGWINSETHTVSTETYGLVSQPQAIRNGSVTTRDSTDVHLRVRAQPTGGKAVFIGVGRTSDVDGYLDNVPVEEVTDIRFSPFRLDTRRLDGSGTPEPPTEQIFWVSKVSGAGQQTLDWVLPNGSGDYRFVLMNADASEGVTVDMSVGVRVPFLRSLGVGMLAGGGVLTAVGVALFIWGLVTKVPPRVPPAGAYPAGAGWPPPGYGPYPPPGYGGYPPGTPPPGWPPAPPYGQAGQPGQPGYPTQPGHPAQPGYPGPAGQPGFPGQPAERPTGPAPSAGEPEPAGGESERDESPRRPDETTPPPGRDTRRDS